MSSENKQWIFFISVLLCLPVYYYFGYFLDRTNFFTLFFAYSFLFLIYILQSFILQKPSLKWLLISAIGLRLIFLFSEPTLSDDIYRYIWDGRLWQAAVNPFLYTPEYIINTDINIPGIDLDIYQKLNSKEYFTIYPPFAQLNFYLSTSMSVENMWISTLFIRVSILFAELISLFAILKILDALSLSKNRMVLYAFNPLVIIELTGNLHFEAWLIAFLLLSFLLLLRNKLILSAVFMALAISTKLWPLMFLPLFYGKMNFSKLLKYYGIVGLTLVLTFIPILEIDLLRNLFSSIDLYFQKFEFNASVFYIARYIGYLWKGYDLVQIIGPLLALITFICIISMAVWTKDKPLSQFPTLMMVAFTIYLLLGTTIHPWYLTLPLALSIIGPYRYMLLWSYLVMLSYFAYGQPDWQESYLLIAIEYILVFLFIIFELKYDSGFKKKLASDLL